MLSYVGYAESAVVSYIIARARGVSSATALARQLQEQVLALLRNQAHHL